MYLCVAVGSKLGRAGSRCLTQDIVDLHCVKVKAVDVVSWMRHFAERDLLILKMDIEGAERGLLPRLVDTGAIKLVDVLLWECHLDSSWCRKWTTKAKAANPSLKVYVEPYPWAKRVPDFVANRGAWCQT